LLLRERFQRATAAREHRASLAVAPARRTCRAVSPASRAGEARSDGAAPSASTAGAVLEIAAAHGWLASPALAAERDRLCGIVFGLQRR
jgi:hypothetical protein